MATLIHEEDTGAREFRVPFDGPFPGAPLRADGELVLRTEGPEARPVSLTIHFHPTDFEFQAQLAAIAKALVPPVSPLTLGREAEGARAVVVYEAEPTLVSQVPEGMVDLETLEAYLTQGPPIFQASEYHLQGVAFERGEAGA